MTVYLNDPPLSRFPADLAAAWKDVPVAIAVDVSDGACQIDPGITPLRPPGEQPRLFGRAVTALCRPPDFGAVLHAINLIQPGDVLVIAAQGHTEHAMIGEILGGQLRRMRAVGLVCDGAIRDVATLSRWPDFSCFARAVTARGPTAWDQGEVNSPVIIGGRVVSPGDLLLGDDDGLAALDPELAQRCLAAAQKKLAVEDTWQQKLAAGADTAETFGLSPARRRR